MTDSTIDPFQIRTGSGDLDLHSPKVMGILNLTRDSFYENSRYFETEKYLHAFEKMVDEEADIIDIGAVSTRPGSKSISIEEELSRLLPALQNIRKHFPDTLISVDTYNSEVARQALETGADMINDISGGSFDKDMFGTIARLKVPYVLMHIRGIPENMQENPKYENVVAEVKGFFISQLQKLKNEGVQSGLILDPGFGFGKTVGHNFELLARIRDFKSLGWPVMAGISRKSMVNRVLNIKPEKALNGTTVLNILALTNGADILRVHDVQEAREAVKLFEYYKQFI